MPDSHRRDRTARLALAIAYVLIVLCAAWYFARLRLDLNREHRMATSDAILAYEAHQPFQDRILVPVLVNALPDWLAPQGKPKLWMLEFPFAVLSVLAFRLLLTRFFADRLLCSLLSLLLIPCMLFNYVLPRRSPLWYPWDVPAVMFFALGLYLLHRKKWAWYYPMFVVATLNRETTCFLAIAYFFGCIGEWRTRRFWGHVAAQLAIWAVVKAALYVYFRGLPGGLTESHIGFNIGFLEMPSFYPFFLSSLGSTWIIAIAGFPLIKDEFFRRALLCMIPFGLGMFLVGRIVETRIYGELIPLTLTATLLIGSSLVTSPRERRDHA